MKKQRDNEMEKIGTIWNCLASAIVGVVVAYVIMQGVIRWDAAMTEQEAIEPYTEIGVVVPHQ